MTAQIAAHLCATTPLPDTARLTWRGFGGALAQAPQRLRLISKSIPIVGPVLSYEVGDVR